MHDLEAEELHWKTTPGQQNAAKTARQANSAMKSMLIVFCDFLGVVLREFVPQSQTVNSVFYCVVLRRLREDIGRKRPDLWRNGNCVLQDDNAAPHAMLQTSEFLGQTNISVGQHPPFSPDLTPADFVLVFKMKSKLRSRHFDSIEEIQRPSQEVLNMLQDQDFQQALQQW